MNVADCAQRANGRLGSSSSYNASIAAPKGMLSSDPATNPDLHTWNRVFVPYCSGDVWVGTKRDPVNPFPQQGAWRGNPNPSPSPNPNPNPNPSPNRDPNPNPNPITLTLTLTLN